MLKLLTGHLALILEMWGQCPTLKLFGCVDIDFESKIISISGGGLGGIVYQIIGIWETKGGLF